VLEALRVVNAPVDAEEAPMLAPSIVPPFMSVVVKTELARVTIPVVFAIEPAEVPSLARRFVTSSVVASSVVKFPVEGVDPPIAGGEAK
jgi:hypothetical protein